MVAEEVGQLEGLFEFLEEDLDTPATAAEVGDGLGAPRHLIRQENHFPEVALRLDAGGNPAQFDRISSEDGRLNKFEDLDIAGD